MGIVHHVSAADKLEFSDTSKVEFSLEMNAAAEELLNQLATELGQTPGTVIAMSLGLLLTGLKAQKAGNRLGVVGKDGGVITEFDLS